jgi:AraC-like DNA-binding protein
MRATKPEFKATAVSTVLTPGERLRVDAAGEGLYQTLHRDDVREVLQDVRKGKAVAVLLSVSCCEGSRGSSIGGMVREIPQIPTLALLSQVTTATPETLLRLGREGVERVVDVRDTNGWRRLRTLLMDDCGDAIQRLVLGQLVIDLAKVSPDCWAFFQALFRSPPRVSTVRRLAEALRVLPSTLMSRFFRAELPAPKRYLAMARLVRAAHLFENQGFSVANVANHLDYSSPQSFGRHVRTMMGMTAVEFRCHRNTQSMLDTFREELVLPYLGTLRQFQPMSTTPSWTAIAGRRKRKR